METLKSDPILEEKYYVSQAMISLGGIFFSALGEALARADGNNTRKIHDMWTEDWQRYKELYFNVLTRKDK